MALSEDTAIYRTAYRLLWLIRVTIFHRPELDCERHSPDWFWDMLPKEKSLFDTDGSHGLPIGNHTSQMFAMLFLTELDRLVRGRWKGEFYGRYVDDMALVACSPTALKHLRKKIALWLSVHKLRLSPKKVYLQYYDKGILFVGGCIKPGRIYVQNRVLCNFYNRMMYFNEKARHVFVFPGQNKQEFEMSMNSYFGLLGAFDEYRQAHLMAGLMGKQFAFAGVDGSIDESLISQPAEKKERGKASGIGKIDHDSLVRELVREIVAQMKEGYKLQVGLVK